MNITLQFFAALREQAGSSSTTVETQAATPGELYQELSQKYSFTLAPPLVRFAVNDEFVPADYPLKEGETLTFIPPVAGG